MSTYNFTYGQYIVKKARPVEDGITLFGTSLICWSRSDKVKYGVFRVDPYKRGDYEAEFCYKVELVPVGKSADIFLPDVYYTSDLWGTKPEMVFDSAELAEKFVDEFLKD